MDPWKKNFSCSGLHWGFSFLSGIWPCWSPFDSSHDSSSYVTSLDNQWTQTHLCFILARLEPRSSQCWKITEYLSWKIPKTTLSSILVWVLYKFLEGHDLTSRMTNHFHKLSTFMPLDGRIMVTLSLLQDVFVYFLRLLGYWEIFFYIYIFFVSLTLWLAIHYYYKLRSTDVLSRGKKGQHSAKESLGALWEKQVILTSFYTGLHIVSTCAVLFLSHCPLCTDFTLMWMLQLLARIKLTCLPAEPSGSIWPFVYSTDEIKHILYNIVE